MEPLGGRPRLLLGLDVGTQSLRAALVDLEGRTVAFGFSQIETTYPRPTWAEQHPLSWWSAATQAVGLALSQGNVTAEQVIGIGIDCTACTVVATDADGVPLRPALLWMDQRAFEEAETISGRAIPILRFVSGRVSPNGCCPRHSGSSGMSQRSTLMHPDSRMHRLDDVSIDRRVDAFSEPRCRQMELCPARGWLAGESAAGSRPFRPAGEMARADRAAGRGEATLSARAAGELGLRAGIPVAQGGSTRTFGMLGMGATRDGDVAVIVGSSTCHLAQSREEYSAPEQPVATRTQPWRGCIPWKPARLPPARFSIGIAVILRAINKRRLRSGTFQSSRCSTSSPRLFRRRPMG